MAGPRLPRRGRAEDRLRLDQPGSTRRGPRRPTYDSDAFGRVAELIARYLGTARFLVIQTAFVLLYIGLNVVPATTFDTYPFNFLTLLLSLQAAYAAPLILLAQNRQDDRDRANLVEDRDQAARNLEDTEFLARELAEVRLAIGEVVTRDFLRSELRELLEDARGTMASTGAARGAVPAGRQKRKGKKQQRRDARADSDAHLVSEPQQPDEHHPAPAPTTTGDPQQSRPASR